jgi:hypothetical protein
VQSRVVEEVVEVPLLAPLGAVDDHTRWHRLPGQLVVDDHGHPQLRARRGEGRDVGLERRVPALVLGDLDVVRPDHGAVRRGVEAQHDPLAGPAAGDAHPGLVPDVTDVVAHGDVRDDVVEARGHRHEPGLLEGSQ